MLKHRTRRTGRPVRARLELDPAALLLDAIRAVAPADRSTLHSLLGLRHQLASARQDLRDAGEHPPVHRLRAQLEGRDGAELHNILRAVVEREVQAAEAAVSRPWTRARSLRLDAALVAAEAIGGGSR